ncbi:MAG: tryptophan synthase subunit alpha [Sphaerochaeta sp.]
MKLIGYLSNGYPTIASSIDMANTYSEAGCDIIEIDFPSKDPFLEGEFIANRMAKALQECEDYDEYMNGMIKVKKNLPNTSFILLVYENTIEEIGVDKFITFCNEYDYKDIILCGIKDNTIKDKIIDANLRVSCYVQYRMDEKEIEFAKNSNGFVYLQAKPSCKEEINPYYSTLSSCISKLKNDGIDRPIYCGVGIHSPEDANMAKEAGADAIFVGSSILKVQDNKQLLIKTIKDFKDEC